MWVADARERRDRPARGAVQPVGRVAEHLGRPTPVVEVELAFRVLGHLLVHPQDFALDHPLERGLLLGVRRRDVGHGTLLNSGNLVPTCGIGQRRDIDCINRENTMIKPGLTLHRLELFLAVLDEGGVGRAAKARNISQPAVSEHLQGLAAHFGVPLLERHGRRVRPTPAARLLEPYARQAVGLLRGAERAAVDLRGLRTGSLMIGASTTPGTYLLPAALGRFHAAHPALALSLQISDTREIERSVAVGQLELGVIGEAPLVPGLAGEPWVKDELVLIVARGHPFARRQSLRAPAIAAEPYIAREEGSSTRGVAERYLAGLGVTLTPAMELGSTEAIREAVAAGLGVALVSRHAVLARDRRIVAARLAGPRWTRDLLIVRRPGTPLGPAGAAFRDLLLEARA